MRDMRFSFFLHLLSSRSRYTQPCNFGIIGSQEPVSISMAQHHQLDGVGGAS
jgi:hypothetical protein